MEQKIDEIRKSLSELRLDVALLLQKSEHYVERIENLDKDIEPIKKHVNQVQAVVAFLLSAGAIAATLRFIYG